MDVNNAFLHGDLTEEINMKPHKGYNILEEKFFRLKKSLYGLKHASRQLYEKLSTSLIDWGFQLPSNHLLFMKKECDHFLALLVYVDDIVVVSNNVQQVQAIKEYLYDLFKIKDFSELKYFLGFKVAWSKAGIHIH